MASASTRAGYTAATTNLSIGTESCFCLVFSDNAAHVWLCRRGTGTFRIPARSSWNKHSWLSRVTSACFEVHKLLAELITQRFSRIALLATSPLDLYYRTCSSQPANQYSTNQGEASHETAAGKITGRVGWGGGHATFELELASDLPG